MKNRKKGKNLLRNKLVVYLSSFHPISFLLTKKKEFI